MDGAKQGCACCGWVRGAMRAVPWVVAGVQRETMVKCPDPAVKYSLVLPLLSTEAGPRVQPCLPGPPGVFTDCYRKDEERAQKLLIRVSEAWGKTTCLQLALEAKNMNFVAHGGVQVGSQW